MEDAATKTPPGPDLSSRQAVHIAALVLILVLAGAWLSLSQYKAQLGLRFVTSGAFWSVQGEWRAKMATAFQAAPPAPAASPQETAVIDALVAKAGQTGLSSEEAAILGAALTRTRQLSLGVQARPLAPAASPQETAVVDALVAKAGQTALSPEEAAMLSAAVTKARQPTPGAQPLDDREASRIWGNLSDDNSNAWSERVKPVLHFIYADLVLGLLPVVALMLSVWRLRQALRSGLSWGWRAAKTYRRYDQVARTLAVAAGLKVAADVALGVMGPYPLGWRQPHALGEALLLGLAAVLWFLAPRLIRYLLSRPSELPSGPDLAAIERHRRRLLIVRTIAAALVLKVGFDALSLFFSRDFWRMSEAYFFFDVFLLLLAVVLGLVTPAVMGWKLRRPGKRELQAELAAAKARADALAQENSQFI